MQWIAANKAAAAFIATAVSFAVPEFRPVAALMIGIAFPNPAGGFFAGVVGSGGDLRAGVLAAVTAGLFNAVHELAEVAKWVPGSVKKIIAHGLVGGISSHLGGGRFASGMLSAGFAQAFAPGIEAAFGDTAAPDHARTIAAAVVSGTAAVLGGGKFANGAVSAAFARMFNDHSSRSGYWSGRPNEGDPELALTVAGTAASLTPLGRLASVFRGVFGRFFGGLLQREKPR